MFGFKGCLIEPIVMGKQVFKQTIILEQMKHFVEFLKNKNLKYEILVKKILVPSSPTSGPEFSN